MFFNMKKNQFINQSIYRSIDRSINQSHDYGENPQILENNAKTIQYKLSMVYGYQSHLHAKHIANHLLIKH